jgi:hypothetical protein
MLWVSENAEFDVDFESIEKVVKKTLSKIVINEKVTEKWSFFTFITQCKSLFCTFSTHSNSASNFAFYDIRIEFLQKYIFLFESEETVFKKR